MNIHDLSPAPGSRKKAKRLGQGIASGTGKTAGKGHKGHKARAGGGVRPGFEGGQMPLARRVPKRGFNNARFAREYQIVNVSSLNDKFEAGREVTAHDLLNAGLIRSDSLPVKILAKGDLAKALTLKVDAVSGGARAKIEAAGGKVEVI
ncbi:50S ribosomal protein L15 [uncultured Fretibacterium sp.]|uniref:50S ribosomal protein L15 n=1 Tax=uncultured Fretibacterium sp. TaxID=1678694 RepID=UPI0028DCBC2B|nr:50S ribosomal protein L15 [uncultured Fretibacterium sp.]